MDIQTPRVKLLSLPAVTVGRPHGSKYMRLIYIFFHRRQKEKRINPASLSPLGNSGSYNEAPKSLAQNLYTASLSSVPASGLMSPRDASSTTPPPCLPNPGLASFHPASLASLGGILAAARGVNLTKETPSLG